MQPTDQLGSTLDAAQLRYLRAAELAEQQRYAEAEAEFTAALHLNPNLHTARFQLGLLQLTCANPQAALTAFATLQAPAVPADLQYFARGLTALIRDDFSAAIAQLETGITLNDCNEALNNDMRMVITTIRNALDNMAATVPTAETTPIVQTDFSLYSKKE